MMCIQFQLLAFSVHRHVLVHCRKARYVLIYITQNGVPSCQLNSTTRTCRFSSGQTRHSLRVEPFETLRCAVAGRQEYILMGSSHANDISKEWQYQQHYAFGINVDKVDLERYPNVSNVPWYRAVVEEGDCLYLPFHWIHQV